MSGSAHHVLVPEVEVRSFKQRSGESLKDAWYRISDSHRRCAKKYSTMILLRNFYVGITIWYRYVLDTLTGGNFLGTPALEASYIIESLVGIPPVNETKIEISLEDVMKKLESIEKDLPGVEVKLGMLLDNTDKLDKSLGEINKRIAVIETGVIHENHNSRIGELEGVIDALSTTFSSLKTQKQEHLLDKKKKFIYVPKVSKPKSTFVDLFETEKEFRGLVKESCNGLFKFSSQEFPKLKNTNHSVDASSLDNT